MIDPDRFWNLLPTFHRRRDIATDGPLRALLEAFSEQAALLEADILRQYDNWFIETCEDWVVPYIGDLVGYTPVNDTGEPDEGLRPEGQALARIATPRREVANTIRYRRSKGTLELLERLAADVAGWPSRVVEFRHRMVATQHIRTPRPSISNTVDVRAVRPSTFGSAADPVARGAEMRRVSATGSTGRFGVYQVGLFVSRHVAIPVTRADAACIETVGGQCFTFSPCGVDTPLYRPAEPGVLPGPLARSDLLLARAQAQAGEGMHIDPSIYGEGRHIMVWKQAKRGSPLEAVPAGRIMPADLRRWSQRPSPGRVALDPETGRLMFPESEAPDHVVVSHYEGATGDLGAGERPRRLSLVKERMHFRVQRGGGDGAHESLRAAIDDWRARRPQDGLIEILDSGSYDEHRLVVKLGAGQKLEIRAGARARPLVRIADSDTPRDDAFRIEGEADSILVLDGLLLSGRGLQLQGSLGELLLRRCTLQPGWGFSAGDALPRPSLIADNSIGAIRVQHSILGPIHVHDDPETHEPILLHVTDSVIDGGGQEAITGPDSIAAHVMLTMRRSTVLGSSFIHAIDRAEDSLFTRRVMVARRQRGCVRFCFLPEGSRIPARFCCLPAPQASSSVIPAPQASASATLAPVFVSQRYGQPGYCQLALDCPGEIRRGASDESELGVFHNLFTPQREANLLARLAEFVPATVDVGVIHVT